MTDNDKPKDKNPNYKYNKAWKERQKFKGMKRIEVYLRPDTYRTLKAIQEETKESYGDILSPLIKDLADRLAVPLWGVL